MGSARLGLFGISIFGDLGGGGWGVGGHGLLGRKSRGSQDRDPRYGSARAPLMTVSFLYDVAVTPQGSSFSILFGDDEFAARTVAIQ